MTGVFVARNAPVAPTGASKQAMKTVLAAVSLLLSTATIMAEPVERNEVHVKDGDTIIMGAGNRKHTKDQEYRLVGYDTPETALGECQAEIEKGNRASARLAALLDIGKLDLTEIQCSCAPNAKDCNYDRRCGRLTVNGRDVGEILIAEELAVPFVCEAPPARSSQPCPKQHNWCGDDTTNRQQQLLRSPSPQARLNTAPMKLRRTALSREASLQKANASTTCRASGTTRTLSWIVAKGNVCFAQKLKPSPLDGEDQQFSFAQSAPLPGSSAELLRPRSRRGLHLVFARFPYRMGHDRLRMARLLA